MNVSMLDAAYKAGVKKFLFMSSNTVYPLTDYPVKEDDCTNEFYEKYHIVAWMKRFTEIVCEMYDNKIAKPMKVVVVRPGNIYGEYDDFEWATSHVIPALVRLVFAGFAISLIYPDRLTQAACIAAGVALFAVLHRMACKREASSALAAA